MNFDELIKRAVNDKDITELRYYADEYVDILLLDGQHISGYASEYFPFWSGDDPDDIVADFSYEELQFRPEGGTKKITLCSKDIKEIHRKPGNQSIFNEKQCEYIKRMGIDPQALRSDGDYAEVLSKSIDYYFSNNDIQNAETKDMLKDLVERIKYYNGSLYSPMECWKVTPLNIDELIGKGKVCHRSQVLCYSDKESVISPKEKENLHIDSTLEQFDDYYSGGKKKEAIDLLQRLVESIDKIPLYSLDGKCEYHNFSDLFELYLYSVISKNVKKIVEIDIPCSEIMYRYGKALFEEEMYTPARSAFEKAMKWEPVNAKIAFAHADTYKAVGDMEYFLKSNIAILEYAFLPEDFSSAYCNIGYYFAEKEMFRESVICLATSIFFDENSNSEEMIYEIKKRTPQVLKDISFAEASDFFETNKIQFGCSQNVKSTVAIMSSAAKNEGNSILAGYMLEILYNLTGDPMIKGEMDHMDNNCTDI